MAGLLEGSLETHAGGAGGGLGVAEGVARLPEERRTHPLYKKLSGINGEVNALSRGQLKQRLRELNMESRLESCIRSEARTPEPSIVHVTRRLTDWLAI